MTVMKRTALALLLCLLAFAATAQPVTVIGTITPGDCSQWSSVTILKDAGFNCNGSAGAVSPGITPTWTGRHIFNYLPVFDLASNLLSVNELFEATNVTVPANSNYSDIRSSSTSGANNTFTIGANGVVSGIYEWPEALSGSDVTSNVYGGILHCQNDGPGTCKGVHAEGLASGSSTGVVVAVNAQVNPVATSNTGSASVNVTMTGGINDIGSGLLFATNPLGERWNYGIGSVAGAVGIKTAFYQAWMASTSPAGARAFQELNNGSTEVFWERNGAMQLGLSGTLGSIALGNATSGLVTLQPVTGALGAVTLSFPAATDTLTGKATTDILTNKTYDTAGTGNVFKINGTQVTAVVGSGQAVLATYVGFIRIATTGVNFNGANTDTAATISLPTGVTRYAVNSIRISNASASISTATVGVFTATGGGGQTIAANQAITVTQSATDTNNNMMVLVTTNGNTEAYNDATLQIRVGTAQGSAATADVIITLVPLT